jgi:hypothetical protein
MANGLFNLKQVMQAVQQGGWPNQRTPSVEYLVVAGGGGGGYAYGGGGGAGGLLTGLDPVPNGQTLLVTVGGGGAGGSSSVGTSGQNSVFGSITSNGGGGGGYGNNAFPTSGGSGGGGAGFGFVTSASGVSGQGNAGGNGVTSAKGGGGGGGAGTVGLNQASGVAGNGGAGIASAINGTVTAYAGGGGGGQDAEGTGGGTAAGAGGVGGGGAGGFATHPANQNGVAGTTNTGGGGGGGSQSGAGGAGGSGVVIISYPDVYAAATATTGSPTVSTSGSGSLLFDGTGDYLTAANNAAFAVGTGSFTVEAWVYPTAFSAYRAVFDTRTSLSNGGMDLGLANSSAGVWGLYKGSGTTVVQSSTNLTLNIWQHIAAVRSGSTVTLYLNGVSVGSATDAQDFTEQGCNVGRTFDNYAWAGYISNFRLVKGTAVYTTTFTPSTSPLTAISNTSLLLNTVSGAQFADSSTNSFTMTRAGDTAWNQLSPFATGLGYKNRVYTWTSNGSITF